MLRITKKTIRKVAILTLVLMLFTVTEINPNIVKAYEKGEELARFKYADGITRYLDYKYSRDYGEYGAIMGKNFVFSNFREIGFDKFGTIWFIEKEENAVAFTSYNPYTDQKSGGLYVPRIPYYFEGSRESEEYDEFSEFYFYNCVDSLVFDENNYVVGFKLFTGEQFRTLTLEEQNELFQEHKEKTYDFSTYLPPDYTPPAEIPTERPKSTVAPSTNKPAVNPTPEPTLSPSNKPAAKPTQEPTNKPVATVTTTPISNNTVTPNNEEKVETVEPKIKTENGFKVYYKGNTAVGKYKLSKKVLTYKGKKYKKVKKAYFIKKSGNVVILDSKKKAYLLKGKSKKLLLKNVKKIVTSGGFATKVKGKKKTISVTSK